MTRSPVICAPPPPGCSVLKSAARIRDVESIEGKTRAATHRPPYVAQAVVSAPDARANVGTLYWMRDIVEKGARVVHVTAT